jgi:DNA polymerase-3 subunit gamma/tau
MSYLVLARKYRPQIFEHVIDQNHVTRTLGNAISSDRVAHAILFSGPRGTGKTTVARILAKSMNCLEGPSPTPCNACRSCKEITAGNAVDVLEIDGASNNSVEQVRDLRENVKYMPAHSPYKIYIIDEVHMLSTSAFNALLKTLEEPPAHILFMFATTEPHKIPNTILSRCQRHDFRRINIESIKKHMETISSREGIDIAAEGLWLIAREAGGSMRDGLSLLDQVMTCSEGSIRYKDVLDILGIMDRKIIYDISSSVLRSDIPDLLDSLDDVYDRGHDMKKLYADMLDHFRNLLVVKMGKNINKLVGLPDHEIDLMRNQVKDVSAAYLNQIFDMLFKEEPTIKFSTQPKLALEITFIRMFQIKPALPIDVLIDKLDHLKQSMVGQQEKDIHDNQTEFDQTKKKDESFEDDINLTARKTSSGSKISEREDPSACFTSGDDLEKIWQKIYEIIAAKYPSLAANLKNCGLKGLSDRNLEIEVRGNGFNVNMVKRSKNLNIIKKVCEELLGKELKILITAKQDLHTDDREQKSQNINLKNEALSHPLVADAIEIFNGRVVDVKIK